MVEDLKQALLGVIKTVCPSAHGFVVLPKALVFEGSVPKRLAFRILRKPVCFVSVFLGLE